MWWLTVLMGCGFLESYEAGVQTFCDAPTRCPTCAEARSDADRAEQATAWAGSVIANQRARMVWDKTQTFAPERRGGVLRAAAAKAGVRPCAMADLYDAAASP